METGVEREGLGPLLRLWPLFTARRGLLAACVVGLMAATLLSLTGPWLIARAVDVNMTRGDSAGLTLTAILYGVAVLGNAGLTYCSRVGLQELAQGAMMNLKRQLFEHLLVHDLSFHDRHPSGALITRIQGDTQSLRVLFAQVILSMPADLLLIVGMFGVMLSEAPSIAWYVAGVIPPYIFLLWWFRKIGPPRFIALRRAHSKLTSFASEGLRGVTMLQRFEREAWLRQQATLRIEEVRATQLPAEFAPVIYFNAVFMVRSLGFASVLVLGGRQVMRGELTIGELLMGLGYMRLMFSPMMRLSQHMTVLERSRAAARRIDAILEQAPTIVSADEIEAWPGLRDALRVEAVDFAYDPNAPVLRGVSLEILAGSRVGIVGATGSGKSTLLNLLMRFRDPDRGRITIDGVDLRALSLSELRAHTGLVLQDIHLLPGTILENLGGDRDRVTAALHVVALDLSPDAMLEEGGHNLSRGERQLLTFARALIDDPALLVLDEATSAIDPGTEARLGQALDALSRGRTTVMVAHRLTTVRSCDVIFVMHRGQLVEQGDHDALIEQGGVYAALHALQQGHREAT